MILPAAPAGCRACQLNTISRLDGISWSINKTRATLDLLVFQTSRGYCCLLSEFSGRDTCPPLKHVSNQLCRDKRCDIPQIIPFAFAGWRSYLHVLVLRWKLPHTFVRYQSQLIYSSGFSCLILQCQKCIAIEDRRDYDREKAMPFIVEYTPLISNQVIVDSVSPVLFLSRQLPACSRS